MYEVGQILNIGYYAGFNHQSLIKTQAEVINVSGPWVDIKIRLLHGGYRKMFGTESQLKELEDNFSR